MVIEVNIGYLINIDEYSSIKKVVLDLYISLATKEHKYLFVEKLK